MKYLYKTATGDVAIEVDEEWGNTLLSFDKKEKNKQKVARRHEVSAVGQEDFFENLGGEDAALQSLLGTVQSALCERVKRTLEKMQPCRAELLQLVYVDKIPQKQLADRWQVSQSAVCQRVKAAKESFKRIFKNLEQEGDAA